MTPSTPLAIAVAVCALAAVILAVLFARARRSAAEDRREAGARLAQALDEASKRERELRLSQERYQLVAEHCAQGVWALDAHGRTSYANAQAVRIMGTTPEELAGKTPADYVVPDDHARMSAAWEARRRGEITSDEYTMVRGDGQHVLLRTHSVPVFDGEGRFAGAFSLITDLTEQRRTESALAASEARREAQFEVTRALAEGGSLPEVLPRVLEAIGRGLGWDLGAFWLTGTDGALTCLEVWQRDPVATADLAAVSRGLSFTSGFGLPGRVLATCEPLWISDLARAPGFTRAPAAARAQVETVFALPVSRGSRCLGVLEFFRRGHHAADPDLLEGFAAVSRQLSMFLERQAAEQERIRLLEREQELRRDAEGANRAKDQFLATLSHELRTPLNAIVGWAHVLRSASSDPATMTRGLEVIERNARAQARLIGDVLDVSRIVSGKFQLTIGEVELAKIVEATVESLRPASETRHQKLVLEIAPDVGVVSGDADRLQQITWNLLSNAIKFTPEKGEVRVSLQRQRSHLELVVADDGPGIAPEFLPFIFERFRQADGSSTRSHGGLGLGLAIVHHLVQLHGGTVEAHSEGLGHGATFIVRLPLIAAGSALTEAPAGTRAAPPLARLDGLDVLVVDDEPDGRELTAALLARLGASVRTAASAAEAFRSLSEARPSVLLSDLEMPDEDGFSLIRRVRRLPNEEGGRVPAVALTAYARPEDQVQAIAAGFDAHLSKPVSPSELASLVARLAGAG